MEQEKMTEMMKRPCQPTYTLQMGRQVEYDPMDPRGEDRNIIQDFYLPPRTEDKYRKD